ncbi:butyrate kinase [candidate division KSB1 bacterium]|nr:butyrate kinase [candidate division KSB1 bacterium]
MYDLEKNIEKQIHQINKPAPTFIFPEAHDPRMILAASRLTNLTKMVLLAKKDDVYRILKKEGSLSNRWIEYFFHNAKLLDHRQESGVKKNLAEKLSQISRGTDWQMNYKHALELMDDATHFAIMAVRMGYADAVLSGLTITAKDFFVPSMNLLEHDDTVFEVAIFALPDEHPEKPYQQRIAIFADVAVNTEMNAEKLSDIAVGACKIAREIIPPEALENIYGAIVSYSTKGSATGTSVLMVREAGEKIPEKLDKLIQQDEIYATIKIESELQISCALSEEAAAFKLKDEFDPDSAEGKANVLIAPNLDLGNFLYHIYALRYPTSKRVLVSGGLRAQAIDFSRSSTVEDIILGAKALILLLKKSPQYRHTPNDTFFPRCRILAINPGSTSTKLAVFRGEEEEFKTSISHSAEDLAPFDRIVDQFAFRKETIAKVLEDNGIKLSEMEGIVGRGGLLAPVKGGTYEVNQKMKQDLLAGRYGEHASNLGALIASELAGSIGKPAYIVDPVVVDEMERKAKITGFREIKRISLWHALNQRSVARAYARQMDKLYEDLNLIIAHLGGGITVGAHRKGRTVDVNDGVHGDGPFSPERAGMIPTESFLDLCFSGKYTEAELRKKIHGKGGMVDLLGTNDMREVEARVQKGDRKARLMLDAMIYTVSKQAASLVPAFEGDPIDAIVLTGGLVFSRYFVDEMKRYLAPLNIEIHEFPGEQELESLRDGILKVLRGEEKAMQYK